MGYTVFPELQKHQLPLPEANSRTCFGRWLWEKDRSGYRGRKNELTIEERKSKEVKVTSKSTSRAQGKHTNKQRETQDYVCVEISQFSIGRFLINGKDVVESV